MPSNQNNPVRHSRRAVYSVVEVAKLCSLSRARFYDLIGSGAMPPPVYDLRTRRPMYTAELAAQCVEVRESNIGIDGRYVMFYERRVGRQAPTPIVAAVSTRRRQPMIDALTQEMVEALRATGVQQSESEIVEAIRRRCPHGLTEERFEIDAVLVRSELLRPTSG